MNIKCPRNFQYKSLTILSIPNKTKTQCRSSLASTYRHVQPTNNFPMILLHTVEINVYFCSKTYKPNISFSTEFWHHRSHLFSVLWETTYDLFKKGILVKRITPIVTCNVIPRWRVLQPVLSYNDQISALETYNLHCMIGLELGER